MEIKYTKHAREQMRIRKISNAMVEEVYSSPESILPGKGDNEEAVKRIGSRRIKVVFQELKRKEETILIITVMSL